MKQIIPAVLTKDIGDLENIFHRLHGLVDWIQVDIMDGRFVNNISVKLQELSGVKHDFRIEAHLMTERPEDYFEVCKQVGISRVIFHLEAASDIKKTLVQLDELNLEKGIALNPATPVELITPYLADLDLVLFLGVNPGLQGQEFIPEVLDKVKELKKISPKTIIELDGGIKAENIAKISAAGVDLLVVGSAVVKQDNIEEALRDLKNKI